MEWDEDRLHAVELEAAPCPDACAADVISLTAEVRRLRDYLKEIESMAARHEESAEWKASAVIPAIIGRARRALRGEKD